VCEDINKPESFRSHLLAIARMEQPRETDRGESWIGDYELEIREPRKETGDPKFTLRWLVKLISKAGNNVTSPPGIPGSTKDHQ
jgi:hypothetical protein